MPTTSPGTKEIGNYRLALNRNGAVVIWCPRHQTWVTAASASRHFAHSQAEHLYGDRKQPGPP